MSFSQLIGNNHKLMLAILPLRRRHVRPAGNPAAGLHSVQFPHNMEGYEQNSHVFENYEEDSGNIQRVGFRSDETMHIPHVVTREYPLNDIDIVDGFLLLQIPPDLDHGSEKADIKLPDGRLGEEIKARFDNGEDLLITVVSALGEESATNCMFLKVEYICLLESFLKAKLRFFCDDRIRKYRAIELWRQLVSPNADTTTTVIERYHKTH
ncbi:hypothetical protein ASPBRDRAFT_68442 [Aspergillus brasiliensis CBS 101740]|uniref:Translation initiation factor 5A C-terminal domain-containing protein n=1 Tax=Aspergillus brasiliensis (strain CBS 101740 / IMI 381727 / IBT 21946) TaxID=767769 RepID=A0A1L9U988_ASPBC|nr:hypothetical protein ASPBRDRAFT_68442 [Aspergillus brasiliensis CBS 101740]